MGILPQKVVPTFKAQDSCNHRTTARRRVLLDPPGNDFTDYVSAYAGRERSWQQEEWVREAAGIGAQDP
jgi:hypothetical protein